MEYILFALTFCLGYALFQVVMAHRREKKHRSFERKRQAVADAVEPSIIVPNSELLSREYFHFLVVHGYINRHDDSMNGAWIGMPIYQVFQRRADGGALVRKFAPHQIPKNILSQFMPFMVTKQQRNEDVIDAYIAAGKSMTEALLYVEKKFKPNHIS